MGKIKNEMRKIHSKKIRKAKEELKLYRSNELSYDRLNHIAKKLLLKQRRKRQINFK